MALQEEAAIERRNMEYLVKGSGFFSNNFFFLFFQKFSNNTKEPPLSSPFKEYAEFSLEERNVENEIIRIDTVEGSNLI